MINTNKEQVLVSIIIPAWNIKQYIHRGIESCLKQSYGNIEVVIVDDGSTDGTLNVAQKYAEKDERVHAFGKEHGGVSAARNFGMKKAQGQIIMFLDSDDWLSYNAVEILMEYYKLYPKYLIGAKSVFVEEGKEDEVANCSGGEIVPIVMQQHEALMNTAQVTYRNSSACYKVFCSSVIQDNALVFDEDISIGEDGLFVFRYLSFIEGMVYIDAPLWKCLVRNGSSTRVSYNDGFITALHAVERMLQYSHGGTDDVEDMLKAFLVTKALDLFRRYISSGNEDEKVVNYIKRYIKKYKKEYGKKATWGQKIRTDLILHMPFPIYLKLYRKRHSIHQGGRQ